MSNRQLYIKESKLKGYRSINDVNISFDKNLNIIIGKNSVGKTNFITFLNRALNFDYDGLNNFSSDLVFYNGDKRIEIKTKKKIENITAEIFRPFLEIELNHDNDYSVFTETQKLDSFFSENDNHFISSLICHGIPKDYKIIDQPFTIKFDKEALIVSDLYSIIKDKNESNFLKNLIHNIIYKIAIVSKRFFDLTSDEIKEELKKELVFINEIQSTLATYSPISDIRFSENFNIYLKDDKNEFVVDNLYLEFKINHNWLPFKFLSDGTKRIFYLISELFEFDSQGINYCNSSFVLGPSTKKISRLFLIEEPELGIHPHQFKKVLDYLKDKSKNYQIFITTHSPQSLDILHEDELNKIIIAYSNIKNETILRKLDESEILKAKKYIDEEFLSDYWLYSDLEK